MNIQASKVIKLMVNASTTTQQLRVQFACGVQKSGTSICYLYAADFTNVNCWIKVQQPASREKDRDKQI